MESANEQNWIYEIIANHTLDIILIVNQQRNVLYATPSFYEIFDSTLDELRNRDVFNGLLHPDDRQYMEERHEKLLETGRPSSTEYRVIDKFGVIRYFECKTTPLPNTEDYLQVVAIRDISERKKMEMELERRKKRYEFLQDSLKIFSQDLTSVMKVSDLEIRLVKEIKFIIPGAEPAIHILESENPIETSLPPLTLKESERLDNKIYFKIGEQNGRAYILSLNESSTMEKMDFIWLETLVCYSVMVFENLNIMENLMNQLKAALQSKETPQWVLRLLFNLQEQQRLQLSSDLHDTVLQDQIDLFRRLEVLKYRKDIKLELIEALSGIEQGLLDSIHQIRRTCNELRPPFLRELGLEKALENLFEYTQISSTFKITFLTKNPSQLSLNEEITIGIYRIIQELLNNAAKHSKASLLDFEMRINETLQIFYCDDGVGLPLEKLKPSFHSMGLSSIKQRVQSLNGQIEFKSKPGKGLKVMIEFPILLLGDV
ncbi:PAS domain-containing sensor histidine kinase [Niallia endozanthoxylica]|uniref:histidine kinase n=1 Tax=Niallia endozanthoxylica TaxID=2036016 RepID=A0A5J5HLG5_9BACI|nr:PAS domain-containing sensor histidine kinase [Niallia endozanthoxylica]KAA9021601.1 PAS domain S-box protein [Niallia endozanthoxylica]